jgi:hypothetical protein
MSHYVSSIGGVLTIRLDGRTNTQDLYQDIRTSLDAQSSPITIIIDLTLARNFDQHLKSTLYRVLQHHHVGVVGICGVNAEVTKDVTDLLPVIRRIRRVTVCETEADLRSELGLSAPLQQQKKLTGMLTYLKKG